MSTVLTNFWKVIKCICSEIPPPNFGAFDFDLKILTYSFEMQPLSTPSSVSGVFRGWRKGALGTKVLRLKIK